MPLSYGDYLTTDCRFRYNRFAEFFQRLYGMTSAFYANSYVTAGKTVEYDYLWDTSRPSSKYVYGTGANTGKLVEVPADTPAFDHDPITGEALGLLIEPSATNYFVYSSDYSNAAWSKTDVTISSNHTTSPFGLADKIVEGASNSSHNVFQLVNRDTSEHYSYIIAKQDGRRYVQLLFGTGHVSGNPYVTYDLQDGVITNTPSGVEGKVTDLGDGWFECGVKFTPAVATFSVVAAMVNNPSATRAQSYVGDGASGILLDHAQLELGGVGTSPIPTSGSTVTRAADIVTSQAATFGEWFDASEGTFVVEWVDKIPLGATSGGHAVFSIDEGAGTNRLLLYRVADTLYLYHTKGGLAVASLALAGFVAGGKNIAAVSFGDFGLRVSLNGGAVRSDPDTVPWNTYTSASLGHRTPAQTLSNLTMPLFTLNKKALTDSELQARSAL